MATNPDRRPAPARPPFWTPVALRREHPALADDRRDPAGGSRDGRRREVEQRSGTGRSAARTSVTRGLVCLALAAPLALAAAPSASATSTSDLAKQVVTLVNAERKKVGCGPVRVSPALTTAAKRHSVDMARYDYFSHTSRDGRTPWQRIRATGYTLGSAENIAAGQSTAKSVMSAGMHSTGHRKNILRCANRAMGVGVARGGGYGIYWTQDFGTR